MKKFMLIFATTLITINVFAAKTYSLTVRVHSLATHEALEGFSVSTIVENVKTEVGRTNVNGEIIISSISQKSIDVLVEDPSGKHRKQTLYYYNPKKIDEVKEINLRLNRNQEESFFNEIDLRYIDSSGVLVNQIPNGKSTLSDKDSIDFIPAYPVGGVSEFYKFIAMNLEYSQDCIEKNIQGKVYVSFIVQLDGTISNVVVEKGVNPNLDEEACRVIRYFPKWNAAISNGKPIRSLVKTSVNFTLN